MPWWRHNRTHGEGSHAASLPGAILLARLPARPHLLGGYMPKVPGKEAATSPKEGKDGARASGPPHGNEWP